jgi:hypothetical protein
MGNELKFSSYRRSEAAATGRREGSRLGGNLLLNLKDMSGPDHDHDSEIPFQLMGPLDVRGLKPDAIKRTYPINGAFNVETDKCPYVEFAAEDLPWRYSPEPNSRAMKPWLLLIVGTPEEVILLSRGRVVLSQSLISDYTAVGGLNLHSKAHLWAHVQEPHVSRLLSPRILEADQRYIAVIVPAFDAESFDRPSLSIALTADKPIQVYYAWHFATGAQGSFVDLAKRLQPLQPPSDIGLAPVAYQTADDQQVVQPKLHIGGALVGLNTNPDTSPSDIDDMKAHFAPIRPIVDSDFETDKQGRPIIQLPVYGAPWLDPHEDEPVWMKKLNDDPRHRGVAGLGMWAGIEWQDRIVKAASEQLGAFFTVSRRIRQLTLGLAASRRLWDRRLPTEPMHRLQVLGLAMSRLATTQGNGLLDHVTNGEHRSMPSAFFSSAARRMLRPSTAHSRLTQPGALVPAALVKRMNTCPPDNHYQPSGLLHVGMDNLFGGDLDGAISSRLNRGGTFEVNSGAVEQISSFYDDEQQRRLEVGLDHEGGLNSWLDAIWPLENAELSRSLLQDIQAPYPTRPCENRDEETLLTLSEILHMTFNPHGGDAFIIRRVLATIEGLDDQPLTPPELCLDFHIPAWKFLKEFAKDWLLPGVNESNFVTLDEEGAPVHNKDRDPVIAVRGNGQFTDAFLIGFNQQALAELRWRNIPVTTGCTPLRRFWEPIGDDGENKEDIIGIHKWAKDTSLGHESHETPEAKGDNLVLIFKSQLWRRYPETLIYLLPPDENGDPDWTRVHIEPSFPIEIEPDIVGFGFAEDYGILDTHWVVVEQVPRGFTFYNLSKEEGQKAQRDATHSAQFAAISFAQPVRVLIRGTELKSSS